MSELELAPVADPGDPAVFGRVWSRVHPDPDSSPVAPALPAAAEQPLGVEGWMDRLAQALDHRRQLARRWPDPVGRLARSHSRLLAAQLRGLDCARFLLTGERYRPRLAGEELPRDRDQALRLCCLTQRRWARQLEEEALSAPDPELARLYLEQAGQHRAMAREVNHVLEQVLGGNSPL